MLMSDELWRICQVDKYQKAAAGLKQAFGGKLHQMVCVVSFGHSFWSLLLTYEEILSRLVGKCA